MTTAHLRFAAILCLAALPAAAQLPRRGPQRFIEPAPIDFNDRTGYTQIFDGATLDGWTYDPAVWRVEDNAMVGESTREKPVGHSYISYHADEAHDFDLKLEIRVENGGGSGIQYRSHTGMPWRPPSPPDPELNLDWLMTGPQADFWYPVRPNVFQYTGQFFSENTPYGILAWRGQVVNTEEGREARLIANIAGRDSLGGHIRINAWNEYHIIARGGTFIQIINGQLMAVLIDDNPNSPHQAPGKIGFEIEGTPSKVSVRNVWLKKLD